MSYQCRNPFNGKVLKTYDDLSDQALVRGVQGRASVRSGLEQGTDEAARCGAEASGGDHAW